MKILHIAPENFAGVPLTIVKAERKLGYYSRLITLYKSKYEEDICLNLPLVKNELLFKIRNFTHRRHLSNKLKIPENKPLTYSQKWTFQNIFFCIRDKIWHKKINEIFRTIDFDFYDFDIYQLDGGLGLLRNLKFFKKLSEKNKKIVCCYYGSDLRTRGVIPFIDNISQLNLTVEYYHRFFHPKVKFVPFPFDTEKFSNFNANLKNLVIGHSPTNRKLKGTKTILNAINDLKSKYIFEFKLIENLPYEAALTEKSKCSIFIDQISDFGYGISSLESLAMGIPTCSSLVKGFSKEYPNHPFIEINENNIYSQLERLILNDKYRTEKGKEGKIWANEVHNYINVVKKIHKYISEI